MKGDYRLNPPDNVDVYERYMNGTITGDVDALTKLIFECLSISNSGNEGDKTI